MPFFIPALIAGIGAAARAVGKKKGQNAAAENELIGLQNRISLDLLNRRNFDPNQPFGTLARGRLFGAIARAWGLDSVVGKELLDHIGNAQNVPGTEAIGGARFQTDPAAYGFPAFQKPKTGGALLEAIGGVMGGVGGALSSFYGGGGGSVPNMGASNYDPEAFDVGFGG